MKKIVITLSLLFFFSLSWAQKFAAIGDFGVDDKNQRDVANLVKSWNPEFIITLGDNNYPDGEQSTIDKNIGKYYSDYIYPYKGSYGSGATTNKFFPVAGNHDYYTSGAVPHYNYFELPGNERYYDFVKGNVHFFAINSNKEEPHGILEDHRQAKWLKRKLGESTAKWKIVYMHHAPYSSGRHGSNSKLQWPYAEWGATVVIAGHDHHYERLEADGIPYFVNGAGGRSLYSIKPAIKESQVMHKDYGAMLIDANSSFINFKFYTTDNVLVDSYTITSNGRRTINKSIMRGTYDVEENETNGNVYRTSTDIELGFDGHNNQNYQTVGLRYKYINIPKGAVINNAYLEFTVEGTNIDPCNIEIMGEKTASASSFLDEKNNVTNRNVTNQRVNWSPYHWTVKGQKKTSPDLSRIIQEIINQPNWEAKNNIALLIKGTRGTRQAESFEGNSGLAPKLIISYTVPSKTVVGRLTRGTYDVEENQTNGNVYMNSTDIELGYDSHNDQKYQTVGLRYKNMDIPKGARISNAFLQFTVEGTNSGTCHVQIKGQKTGSASSFLDEKNNVTNRNTTYSKVNWSPGSWTVKGEKKKSPDISNIIQEIVNQSNWDSGNHIAIMIKGTSGTRQAESYEGDRNAAPILVVTYQDYNLKASNNLINSRSIALNETTGNDKHFVLNVSPNPILKGNPLTIKLGEGYATDKMNLNVYDVSGRLIWEKNIVFNNESEQGEITFNLPSVMSQTGVYIMALEAGDWKENVKLLVKD